MKQLKYTDLMIQFNFKVFTDLLLRKRNKNNSRVNVY